MIGELTRKSMKPAAIKQTKSTENPTKSTGGPVLFSVNQTPTPGVRF